MTTFTDQLSAALLDAITFKFNENHDEQGRFASGDSGGSSGASDGGGSNASSETSYHQPNDFVGAETHKIAKRLSDADKISGQAKQALKKVPPDKERHFNTIMAKENIRSADGLISSGLRRAAMGKRGIDMRQADTAHRLASEAVRLLDQIK